LTGRFFTELSRLKRTINIIFGFDRVSQGGFRMSHKIILSALLFFFSVDLIAFDLSSLVTTGNNLAFVSAKPTPPGKFRYSFPEISLIDQNNQPVSLDSLFNNDKNVVFAFFFTHCVTVCTTVTLSLKSIQPHLPEDTIIAMISIDPDTDTPAELKNYADQHRIKNPNWYLLTGESKQIVDFQKGFEAYRGNKMNHSTSLFVKQANSEIVTEVKNNFSTIPLLLKTS
jgi:cytochrome oxidase Cu insertion factor (SCO1/SenC/PrrC family)